MQGCAQSTLSVCRGVGEFLLCTLWSVFVSCDFADDDEKAGVHSVPPPRCLPPPLVGRPVTRAPA
ncbi:hypothetical protein EON66_02155 [archaeon]|nr:MAG: hypothetical protein EON66_02155 [archaeon]